MSNKAPVNSGDWPWAKFLGPVYARAWRSGVLLDFGIVCTDSEWYRGGFLVAVRSDVYPLVPSSAYRVGEGRWTFLLPTGREQRWLIVNPGPG